MSVKFSSDVEMAQASTVYESLATSLAKVNHSLVMSGARKSVPEYKGNPKAFKKWIKSVEKYCYCVGANDRTTQLVAYQSSSGAVSDFMGRYLKEENKDPGSWNDLKQELRIRFSYIHDSVHAFSVLNRTFKQWKNESVNQYAERLYDLAEDAYDDLNTEVAQFTLVTYFIEGLCNTEIQDDVMRAEPKTVDEAIKLALGREKIYARFNFNQ